MERLRKLFLLLPAYNEAHALSSLIPSADSVLQALPCRLVIIVVDDGSTDGTAEAAMQASPKSELRMIRHEKNRGLGAAIRTGFAAILPDAADDDIIVTMDADGTHNPDLIPDMLAALDMGHDVVIASRFAPGGRVVGVPAIRRLLSRIAALAGRWLSGIPGVRDYSSGYRAYRASALKKAWELSGGDLPSTSSFAATAEVLLKLGKAGVTAAEVPLHLQYNLKRGASKMKLLRTCFFYLLIYVRNRRSSA